MKITCPTLSLRETLRLAAKGVKKTSPIPVLQHIKLETDANIGVSLTATDYELEICCATGATINTPGAVAVPARQFLEIVGAASGKEIVVESDEQHAVRIKSGRSRWRLTGMAASEFPLLPLMGKGFSGVLPQWKFKQALSIVAHAISKDENRPSMTGAMFHCFNDGSRLVATDSYRLVSCRLSYNFQPSDGHDFCVIIPRRAVTELIPFLSGDADEDVIFQFDESHIQFKTPFYTIKSRLLAGTFPNVDKIIDLTQTNRHAVTVWRILLIEALKRAEIMAREDLHRVRLEVSGDTLGIYASAADIGDSGEELEIVQAWEPEDMTLWFRADQLLDAISVFDTEQVTLGYETPQRPLLLYPGDVPYFEVLMPVCAPDGSA